MEPNQGYEATAVTRNRPLCTKGFKGPIQARHEAENPVALNLLIIYAERAMAQHHRRFQCLLSEAKFTTSFFLTRHAGLHEDQLLRPLKCPASARYRKDVEVAGSLSWSIHCKAFHGPKVHTKTYR